MKFNWFQKKLTFMIIPENAHLSVIRLRLPQALAVTICSAILGVLGVSFYVYSLQVKNYNENARIQAELNEQKTIFNQTLAVKDESIQELQGEVLRISQLAKDVEQKMLEIDQLESELRKISGEAPLPRFADAGSSSVMKHPENVALGGLLVPASNQDVIELSHETSQVLNSLSSQIIQVKDELSNTRDQLLEKQYELRITPSIWPVGSREVSSGFGYRRDPFTGQASFHEGYDISADYGAPVWATADGIVVEVGFEKNKGNYVLVDHSRGIRTMYMHMSETLVKRGQKVEKSDQIGKVGSTGRSTGPHLHYEVLKNGRNVNPILYLQKKG